jgi:hypothetical protein
MQQDQPDGIRDRGKLAALGRGPQPLRDLLEQAVVVGEDYSVPL